MANITPLTTGTNSGIQTGTQSPQNSVQPSGFSGAPTSAVQPGTNNTLLNNSNSAGIPLGSAQLSTVSLAGASTTAQTATTTTPHHRIHPALFGFSALLLIVAVYMFWTTSKSAKNTTE